MRTWSIVLILGSLGLAACTPAAPSEPDGAGDAPAAATDAAPAPEVVATEDSAASQPTADAAAAPVVKVSANNATEEELVAAFEAAGIENAEKWADEVVEYRPYDAADPSLATLKEELAKYEPDDATLEKILSVLEP